jgi:hypothetical protein
MRTIAFLFVAGVTAGWAAPAARADILFGVRPSDVVVAAAGDDISTGPHDLGFTFPFYGSSQTHVFMNSNGNLSFGAGFGAFLNGPLAGAGVPLIAPFWDDFYLYTGDMRINTSRPGEFVSLWNGVGFYDGPGTNTFEVILLGAGNEFGFAPGSILFSYGNIDGIDHYSNDTASAGVTNGASVYATLAPFLSSDPDGPMNEDQAISLSGRTFLFAPDVDRGYAVTEVHLTPVPAPPAAVLAAVGGVALFLRRRLRPAAAA